MTLNEIRSSTVTESEIQKVCLDAPIGEDRMTGKDLPVALTVVPAGGKMVEKGMGPVNEPEPLTLDTLHRQRQGSSDSSVCGATVFPGFSTYSLTMLH